MGESPVQSGRKLCYGLLRMVEPTPNIHPAKATSPLRFLVIDDNPDGRFLISKTLLRKFPTSTVVECQSAESAFQIVATEKLSLVVSHRTFDCDGPTLVRELRSRAPHVPIVMMSGIDRQDQAVSAGANTFLTYDEWLMIGNRVVELLGQVTADPQTAALR